MHVGYGAAFQNPNNALSDAEVYQGELRLAELAEPLGFDSVWSIEHHFTDYTMCPDALQFLSYMAGKTSHQSHFVMGFSMLMKTRLVQKNAPLTGLVHTITPP